MTTDCVFFCPQTGVRDCPTCQGSVRIKVFECHHPRHKETTINECRNCRDFLRQGDRKFVQNWSVGITTAPRQQPTLTRCLASLDAAGWNRVSLFAEPDSVLPVNTPGLTVSQRPRRMGAFPNWYLSLTEMVMADPHADAYFFCQDDVILTAGLRKYLEDHLWPAANVGVVSVYCPSHYEVSEQIGFREINYGPKTWGALAYVFPNPAVRQLLADEMFIDHRHHGPREGLKNIDSLVGNWCFERNLGYYVHSPSLAQHIGKTSTLWDSGVTGRRRAQTFLDDVRSIEVAN